MSAAVSSPPCASPDVWMLILSAKLRSESLKHLLRVADEYVADAFRPPVPAECMLPLEATMSLIDAARLMAGALDDILARAEALEPSNLPADPIAKGCVQPRHKKG